MKYLVDNSALLDKMATILAVAYENHFSINDLAVRAFVYSSDPTIWAPLILLPDTQSLSLDAIAMARAIPLTYGGGGQAAKAQGGV